jgi:hypothetical protein
MMKSLTSKRMKRRKSEGRNRKKMMMRIYQEEREKISIMLRYSLM